jgi:Flp pilus assembly pilin Flp
MMTTLIARLIKDDDGQDLIEYALIGGLVALAVTGALSAFATEISKFFDRIVLKLQGFPAA